MSEQKDIYTFKVAICGDGAVGKTSLINRFVEGTFTREYLVTLGVEITKYGREVRGDEVNLIFWDLAGQDQFSKVRQRFFSGTSAAILVFSHERNEEGEKSFQHLQKWLDHIRENCGDIPIILFGNKVDLLPEELYLDDRYPKSDNNLKKLASDLGLLDYFKTSALTGEGVMSSFRILTHELHRISKERASRSNKDI
jgi:small GTP-binding protein